MPAIYTHSTQQTGATVTEQMYNQAHQNHITNGGAFTIGGYSATDVEMQTTADPGELGTESLAEHISDELERLRFIIGEMKNTDEWYEREYTAVEQVHCIEQARATLQSVRPVFVNAQTNSVSGLWVVPKCYVDGDIVFTAVVRESSATGDIRYTSQVYSVAAGAPVTLLNTPQTVAASTTTAEVEVESTLAEADVPAAGTPIIFVFGRLGADGADTNTGIVSFQSMFVTYTAVAGAKE